MSDPRTTPDLAHCLTRDPVQIITPVADLCRTATGPRDRQVILGENLVRLNTANGWSYVQADKDGYCGYLPDATLGPVTPATHWVTTPATHAYSAASIKSAETLCLSHTSRVTVTGTDATFAVTPHGYIPASHLSPIADRATDPASVAALYLGTPYLWGGNSRWGIDCSGLVQSALTACGLLPGRQRPTNDAGRGGTPYKRNDLLFWKGHVALVTDPDTMIHANAHAMAVTYEPITDAIARISASGDGPVTAHRRLPALSG